MSGKGHGQDMASKHTLLRGAAQDTGEGRIPHGLEGGIVRQAFLQSLYPLSVTALGDLGLLHLHLQVIEFFARDSVARIHPRPTLEGDHGTGVVRKVCDSSPSDSYSCDGTNRRGVRVDVLGQGVWFDRMAVSRVGGTKGSVFNGPWSWMNVMLLDSTLDGALDRSSRRSPSLPLLLTSIPCGFTLCTRSASPTTSHSKDQQVSRPAS